MKMQWIPTAQRLPPVDDLKVKRPYWQRFVGYIEGMVVITVKSQKSTLREVHFAMCVVPPPWSDGTKPKPWFETPEGKSFDESRRGLIITAWSPVDVPGPYQEGDK